MVVAFDGFAKLFESSNINQHHEISSGLDDKNFQFRSSDNIKRDFPHSSGIDSNYKQAKMSFDQTSNNNSAENPKLSMLQQHKTLTDDISTAGRTESEKGTERSTLI